MNGLFIFFTIIIIALIWLMVIVARQKETIRDLKLTIEDLNIDNNGLCKENLKFIDKLLEAGI